MFIDAQVLSQELTRVSWKHKKRSEKKRDYLSSRCLHIEIRSSFSCYLVEAAIRTRHIETKDVSFSGDRTDLCLFSFII